MNLNLPESFRAAFNPRTARMFSTASKERFSQSGLENCGERRVMRLTKMIPVYPSSPIAREKSADGRVVVDSSVVGEECSRQRVQEVVKSCCACFKVLSSTSIPARTVPEIVCAPEMTRASRKMTVRSERLRSARKGTSASRHSHITGG